PGAGRTVSDRVPGCVDGEGTGRRACAEQGDLRCTGREPGGAEGSAGAMGGAGGRSEVLVAGFDRATESRGEGYFHRLRGRAERIPEGGQTTTPTGWRMLRALSQMRRRRAAA